VEHFLHKQRQSDASNVNITCVTSVHCFFSCHSVHKMSQNDYWDSGLLLLKNHHVQLRNNSRQAQKYFTFTATSGVAATKKCIFCFHELRSATFQRPFQSNLREKSHSEESIRRQCDTFVTRGSICQGKWWYGAHWKTSTSLTHLSHDTWRSHRTHVNRECFDKCFKLFHCCYLL
jgi:hypothetical protein